MKMLNPIIRESGVTDSSSSNGATPGRGGTGASHAVILRNPYDGFLMMERPKLATTWNTWEPEERDDPLQNKHRRNHRAYVAS